MTYRKGNILWVPNERRNPRFLKHAAVVWDSNYDGNGDFNGIMLTHSSPNNRFDNILMTVAHFENDFEFKFDNTHFVNQIFTKFGEWGPFYFAGNLTYEGIQFIESQLSNHEPIEFKIYRMIK